MSESTYRALCYRGAGCLSGVGTYLPGTVLQCCRLYKQCQNLPARLCVTVVKAVLAMSEPICRALCYSVACCLSIVGTCLPGTVLQGCRLLQHCLNLPTMHCVAGVQAVLAMSEFTCWALCYSGADCLSGVGNYLPELCYSVAGCLSGVRTYLPGTVLQWCRLFKQCQNLPAGHCVTVVQAV